MNVIVPSNTIEFYFKVRRARVYNKSKISWFYEVKIVYLKHFHEGAWEEDLPSDWRGDDNKFPDAAFVHVHSEGKCGCSVQVIGSCIIPWLTFSPFYFACVRFCPIIKNIVHLCMTSMLSLTAINLMTSVPLPEIFLLFHLHWPFYLNSNAFISWFMSTADACIHLHHMPWFYLIMGTLIYTLMCTCSMFMFHCSAGNLSYI